MPLVKISLVRVFVPVLVLSFVLPTLTVQGDEPNDSQTRREAAFSTLMKDCVLIGSFTVDGREETPPKTERYQIESVTKVAGNLWTFMTHIKYGNVDTRLPVTVPVEWAGDTPMVSLTNASIPGLGDEFSARVIFHDNRYAGTWQHGKAGGHMFGRIERGAEKESE
ncbi:MAG: hypothetical protein KDA89_04030 [Planctomycetaceae bacterium]|nr:hypothetical protein [Planctomycetaceae bacterium]